MYMKKEPRPQNYGWMKFMRGPINEWLQQQPHLNHLLSVIASRTCWREPNPRDRTEIGEALISAKICGLTRQEYRSALLIGVQEGLIEYSTTILPTRFGSIVKLTDVSIYDVNISNGNPINNPQQGGSNPISNPQPNQQQAISQPYSNQQSNPIENNSVTLQSASSNGSYTGKNSGSQKPTTLSSDNSQPTTPQNATLSATHNPTTLLKKSEEEKEKEITKAENGSAPSEPEPEPESSLRSDPGACSPAEKAKMLAADYPLLVEMVCGEFTRLNSKGWEGAVDFFDYNPDWTPNHVLLLGFKALEATKVPAGAHERFWWCRHYARNLNQLVTQTTARDYPILRMSIELGYECRHQTCQSADEDLINLMRPYREAYEARHPET